MSGVPIQLSGDTLYMSSTLIKVMHLISLAPDCSRRSSPNIQSGKYNEMDPVLTGTAVSVVTYTDFIALVPPDKHLSVGNERNKVGVREYKNPSENKISASILADV